MRQVPQPHSHFHVTGLLVVAEGAGELGLQGACHLLLGGWLPFRLSAPHVCRGVNLHSHPCCDRLPSPHFKILNFITSAKILFPQVIY